MLSWIPGHIGRRGDERANAPAKQGFKGFVDAQIYQYLKQCTKCAILKNSTDFETYVFDLHWIR